MKILRCSTTPTNLVLKHSCKNIMAILFVKIVQRWCYSIKSALCSLRHSATIKKNLYKTMYANIKVFMWLLAGELRHISFVNIRPVLTQVGQKNSSIFKY